MRVTGHDTNDSIVVTTDQVLSLTLLEYSRELYSKWTVNTLFAQGMANLASKLGQICPKWDKSVSF